MWGIPAKCADCRRDYAEGNQEPPCLKGEPCIVTKRRKVVLNYEEFRLFRDFIDYWNTDQILTQDRSKRDTLIRMRSEALELYKIVGEKNANARPENKNRR